MFKKFKDKLAEEMKQSPARLQASMQQLAQAVVSPALSNSSIQELSASNDNFSLTEEGDETPKNSPARHGFQNVDLTSPSSNSMGLSRRSSVSSVTSVDAASLFPIYESPGNMYHLQSDMEQSASEADEKISPQLDRVSKDQLYSAYRKVQTKYHKYRGRYTDLANHYREMERVKGKLESLLVETQDKALRRIADLKEQCQLEQQAKAHLEEALRNDIEEKDHVIDTLNTKVRLLQASGPFASSTNALDESTENNRSDLLVDISTEIKSPAEPEQPEASVLLTENAQLKSKLEKLESIITKYKESLKRNKEKMSEITQDKNIIERDFEISRKSTTERFSQLEDDLNVARTEISSLRDQMTAMRKREEESVISLAENKLTIHRELEVKEEQIKELRKELALAKQTRESLEESVERHKSELQTLRVSNDESTDAEKADLVRDLSKGKTEALKLMQAEMQRRVIELEETMGRRCHEEESKCRELTEKLERREEDLRCFERETVELRSEAEDYREKCDALRNELSIIKDKEYRNEIDNRNVDAKRNESVGTKRNETESLPPTARDNEEKEAEVKKNEAEQRYNEVETKLRETANKYADVQRKFAEAESKLEETEKMRKEAEDNYNELKNKVVEAETKRNEVVKTYKEVESKLSEAEKLCGEVEQRRDEAEEKLKDTEKVHNELLSKLAAAEQKFSDVEREMNEAEVRHSEIERRRNETATKHNEVEENLKEAEKMYSELEQHRAEAEVRYNEVEKRIKEMEKLYSELEFRRNEAEKLYNEMELRRTEAEKLCNDVVSKDNEASPQVIEAEIEENKAAENSVEAEAMRTEQKLPEKGAQDSKEAENADKTDNPYRIECEKLREELSVMRLQREESERIDESSGIAEKEETIRQLSSKVQLYATAIQKARERLESQQSELSELRNSGAQENELSKLREETESKSVEILGIASELKSCKTMINDLRDKIRDDGEKIDLLRKEKICLISNVLEYRKTIVELKGDCAELRKKIEDSTRTRNVELRKLAKIFEEKFANFSNVETTRNAETIERFEKTKNRLENELMERNNEIAAMREKVERWDDTNRRNDKLIAEIDSLNFKIYDLEKVRAELAITRERIASLESENVELRKSGDDESSKLRAEAETREKNLQELQTANDELRRNGDSLKEINDKIKIEYENERRIFEEKKTELEKELERLKIEHDNREKIVDDYAKKLNFFEAECAERDRGLETLRVEMEKREKLLEDMLVKSTKSESELSRLNEEKLRLETKLADREKISAETTERMRNSELELTKLNEERTKLIAEFEKLTATSAEFEGSNEALKEAINSKNALLKKLKVLKERQAATIQENATRIVELETRVSEYEAASQELEAERTKNSELMEKIAELEIAAKKATKEREDLEKIGDDLLQEKVSLATTSDSLRENIKELEIASKCVERERDDLAKIVDNLREDFERAQSQNKESKERCNELERTNDDTKKLVLDAQRRFDELEEKSIEQTSQVTTLRNEIAKREEELKLLGENSGKRLEDFEELREKLEQDFHSRADRMEDEYMVKYREKELEMKNIEIEFETKLSERELELRRRIEEDCKDDSLKILVQELQTRLQNSESKLSSCEARESQIEMLNEELKTRAERLKVELETNEAEQSMRLKQLVKEFQAQLHDKDEELQAALDKRFESQQNYESDLVQQYREQLKDFQVELTAKSEQIERLIVENKEEIATKRGEIEKLIDTIGKIKQEHANELREVERKWKITLKQRSDQLETKHDEEVNELTQEWQNERRNDEKTDDSPEELESTSRVAMAAVQSNTGSLHSLQQTMVSQRRELAELRKLVKLRQDTLEDSTEIEYLRNILYEYMMGRETVVLARVIAAVVKFDQDQTTKILKKEEDKLTLLGSLGLT